MCWFLCWLIAGCGLVVVLVVCWLVSGAVVFVLVVVMVV